MKVRCRRCGNEFAGFKCGICGDDSTDGSGSVIYRAPRESSATIWGWIIVLTAVVAVVFVFRAYGFEASSDAAGIFIWVTFWAFITGGIGYVIGRWRGRASLGFLLGALLGPVGWLIVACLSHAGRRCRLCLGVVPEGAVRCRHCGGELSQFRV